MKAVPILLLSLMTIVFLSGCTSQPQNNPPPQQPPGNNSTSPQQVTVTIRNFAFDPPTITVKSGTTVTWVNEDSTPHLVASDPHPTHTDLPGLVSGTLSQGQSYSFTFVKVGAFGYHCHIHPSMKGTVIVEE